MDGRKIAFERDRWFASEEGERLCEGSATGQYLRNRLERAFLAGVGVKDCEVLPLSQMARRLKVTVAWLRAEAEAGRVPSLKADKRFLFAPHAVLEKLAERAASGRG